MSELNSTIVRRINRALQCDTYITYITYIKKDTYLHYVTLQCLTLLLKKTYLQILFCLNIIYFLFSRNTTIFTTHIAIIIKRWQACATPIHV